MATDLHRAYEKLVALMLTNDNGIMHTSITSADYDALTSDCRRIFAHGATEAPSAVFQKLCNAVGMHGAANLWLKAVLPAWFGKMANHINRDGIGSIFLGFFVPSSLELYDEMRTMACLPPSITGVPSVYIHTDLNIALDDAAEHHVRPILVACTSAPPQVGAADILPLGSC